MFAGCLLFLFCDCLGFVCWLVLNLVGLVVVFVV